MGLLPANGKLDLKPKRRHGYAVVLFIFGTLFPPLAVAARFGLGTDFWLNLFLTICGYIPGHVHNFYIQNIRNNKNHARTPKWIQKYGLVNTDEIKRKERKSQWAGRYNERNPHSTLADQQYEDGQEGGSSIDLSNEGEGSRHRNGNTGEYWNPDEEQFYNPDPSSTNGSGGGRWHYPANFEDTTLDSSRKKSIKKKKEKKDRWARTEDAYSINESGAPKKKKSKKRKSTVNSLDGDTYSRASGSTTEFPEDPSGGLYSGNSQPVRQQENGHATSDDIFSHEF
ncbi:hypothetical protein BC835DRAFT_1345348 [Cytidiella melzeri]|nr:hypothetical protein BC835DRAFT_1345348 [Cytidiella melzeri]